MFYSDAPILQARAEMITCRVKPKGIRRAVATYSGDLWDLHGLIKLLAKVITYKRKQMLDDEASVR